MMSLPDRLIFAFSLAALATLWPISSTAQVTNEKKPTGSVSGKVTIQGKPASGVPVSARTESQRQASAWFPRVMTDQEGRYHLTGLPAGNYQISSMARAFVSKPQSVILADGESVDGIDLTLVRGGVITGKISDADGHPVIAQPVRLYRADQTTNQRGPMVPAYTGNTDDLGVYRIFGLDSGKYRVGAGDFQAGTLVIQYGGSSYKAVFYPDAADLESATIIEVGEGSEAANIDMVLSLSEESPRRGEMFIVSRPSVSFWIFWISSVL